MKQDEIDIYDILKDEEYGTELYTHGELTIIGELIAKNESEDTLTFGDQYEIENQKFVTVERERILDMKSCLSKAESHRDSHAASHSRGTRILPSLTTILRTCHSRTYGE